MSATTVKKTEANNTPYMPVKANTNPEATEVIVNITPIIEPDKPLALSRKSSSTKKVTIVGKAIFLIFPAIVPKRIRSVSIQSSGCAIDWNDEGGVIK